MRVTSQVEHLVLQPGVVGRVPLSFHNTSDVIDQITVSGTGLDGVVVRTEPLQLALFPDTGGEMTATIELPTNHPAGTYLLTLVGRGVVPGGPVVQHHIELLVPEQPALTLSAAPTIVRGHRQAEFIVEAANDGNTNLEAALRVQDDNGLLGHELVPSTITVPVSGHASSTVVVRAPRRWIGGDLEHPFMVVANAPGAQGQVGLVFRQRPLIGRGMLTALVLMAILVLWALAFLLGVRQVMGIDPFAKQAPASFFAGQSEDGMDSGGSPEGAMPKSGTVPGAVGASITGVVTGKHDAEGVGRIRIDILRQGRDGLVDVASTATRADGTYTASGLLPGSYLVRVDQKGYDTRWYPDSGAPGRAMPVAANAQAATEGIDLELTGDPARLGGTVEIENVADVSGVRISAIPAWPGADEGTEYTTVSAADGSYSFADLPAPGRYELTFEAEGVQPTVITERVLGGQDRFALDVVLGAQSGSISGHVMEGNDLVGGATVSTAVDGKAVEVGTPTVGDIGSFVLPDLPTPGTYVLTVSKPGYASRTSVVSLEAGENEAGVKVHLTGGAGQIDGRITAPSGAGAGGVEIKVDGAGGTATTTSLTGAEAGRYIVSGLVAPGEYTATFTLEGHRTVTIPIVLTADKPSATENVRLESDRGTVKGRVLTAGGTGVNGVIVQVTNGLTVRQTVTARGTSGAGSWSVEGLPAGDYTITATRNGVVQSTVVVEVDGGETVSRNLRLEGP